ncbi:Oxidoreductase [Fulvia fulva]|uniref:Oxidoreductase n=1 Tax=Passalora fulva TaxID=5499 RepID=A0A9Q8UU82_PASFU|nr:Oxidoreductase [Fulvia fulva]UJO22527.1 Oxidoreductase [Fulvia fulva]
MENETLSRPTSFPSSEYPIVQTDIVFLAKEKLYETVKPYSVRYRAKQIPPSNIIPHHVNIQVRDVRTSLDQLSLDRNGFEVHDFHTTLAYEDFDDKDRLEDVYLAEIRAHLLSSLKAKNVITLNYTLRKRHASFPISTGLPYEHGQPVLFAHIDSTYEDVKKLLEELYPTCFQDIQRGRYQVITAWKPLHGPVRDWPLAVCDTASVNYDEDITHADVVKQARVSENCLVHHHPAQKWCYIGDQAESGLLLIKSMDSNPSHANACPHTAFPIPSEPASRPRESKDVKTIVMYADMDYPDVEM